MSDMDSTLTGLLAQARKALGEDAAPDELAFRLIHEVFRTPGTAEQKQDLLLPAVTVYVKQQLQERAEVLRLEKRVFSGVRGDSYVNPAEDGMRKLLQDTCYIPGEGSVPWGNLTAELHQRRIDFLQLKKEAFVAGIDDTVSRHRAAIEILVESGCRTLNEYEDTREDAAAPA
jgi:hypothetical protein